MDIQIKLVKFAQETELNDKPDLFPLLWFAFDFDFGAMKNAWFITNQ